MDAGKFLRAEDLDINFYPTGNDQFLKIVHTPTEVSVGEELRGRDPRKVRQSLITKLKTQVRKFYE